MKIKVLFATVRTLASFTAGYAQALDKAKLDQFFDRLAEKNKAMGSLTIAKDSKVVYTRAIGYAQVDGTTKKPLTAASSLRIASITKTYSAVMILQLVEEGKVMQAAPSRSLWAPLTRGETCIASSRAVVCQKV